MIKTILSVFMDWNKMLRYGLKCLCGGFLGVKEKDGYACSLGIILAKVQEVD